jgi:hypothetical protein
VKDQYFGDVNDYRKYGLLRALLEGSQWSLGVCWLRTNNDARRDGESRAYLRQPERWRHYDPALYDALRRLLDPGVARSVRHVASWRLLPGAFYHHGLLTDDARDRHSYFAEAWHRLREPQLLFLDPDNGLEVPSVVYGRRASAKYLYWREVEDAYRHGHSLLIYQHFRRRSRDALVTEVSDQLRRRIPGALVESFRTADAVFLVALRPEHAGGFEKARRLVSDRWNGQIRRVAQ